MNSAVKILTISLVFLCLFVCASASTLSSAGVHGDSVLSSEETGPLYAIRTNLLVPALNIGAEVPIGNNWSVSADYYYPWIWPGKENKNCFELLAWSAEGRYWFGNDRTVKDRLLGHSVGLYAAGGYFDIERNFKGRQGTFISTGVDYTYAMPLGRKKLINLEFTFAMGYVHSWNRIYTVSGPFGPLNPEPGTELFDYFGPTKAAVSLVLPLVWPWKEKEGRK